MGRHRGATSTSRLKGIVEVVAVVVMIGAFAALITLAPRLGEPRRSAATTTPSAPSTPSALPLRTVAAPAPIRRAEPPQPTRKPSAAPSCRPPQRVRVTTFNIKGGRISPGELAPLAAHIRAADPDVVLLQEVDDQRRRSGDVDQPGILAAKLGMHSVFGANDWITARGGYGTAVLSRFPVTSWRNTHLPNRRGVEQRGVLRVSLDVGGQRLVVFNTHLDNTSGSLRREQINAIVPMIRAYDGAKLLGGDLNSAPDTSVLATARSVLTDSAAEVGAARPTHDAGGRVDYLLHGPLLTPVGATISPTRLSDHHALTVDFLLTDPHC